jgi:alpha-beta hydrolase superfamily lysophospholipase
LGHLLRRAAAWTLATALTLCAGGPSGASAKGAPTSWVDEPVTFVAGGVAIYATFRHPVRSAKPVPGVLLIAGSGPTDRNGNSSTTSGRFDTLKELADWLSADGVATLRYDKLGSGQTGLGPYATKVDSIGIEPFEQESATALDFLARQKGIDDQRLGVFGHSEGALFALLLATGHAGSTPPIHALGLFEPLSIRYLDLIAVQVGAQVAAQVKAGEITEKLGRTVDSTLQRAIARLRSTGAVAANLPYGLASLLNAGTAKFLAEADRYDPRSLAASLAKGTPVIVSCSNADVEVTCGEVDNIVRGLAQAGARADVVRLAGVDHVLKVDPTGAAADWTKPLPFSPVLRAALRRFVDQEL